MWRGGGLGGGGRLLGGRSAKGSVWALVGLEAIGVCACK